MSTYALQTKTMLKSASNPPIKLLGQATRRDESKPQLPSKRTRDDICGLGPSNKPFAIRPHPCSPNDTPLVFIPLRVIARSQLPLTFLDATSDKDFAPTSLFSAHIDVLEDDESLQKGGSPKVLVARLEPKRTLYAIELVRARIYSLCRLASGLKEKELAHLWDPSVIPVLELSTRVTDQSPLKADWWQHAVVEPQPGGRSANRAKMMMMAMRPRLQAKIATIEQPQQSSILTTQVSIPLNIVPTEVSVEPVTDLPTPEEQLASMVQQYLDAVYLSKTSLAYLAKGPITRIRNAFTSPEQGAPQTHELVTFLRTMLLSPRAGEKKYYEKLPSIIKALPPRSFSDEESLPTNAKSKKIKKKLKLNREGIYPQEELVIKKWWWSEVPSGDSVVTETIDQRIKRRIGDLRVRETLAQLILMLEIVGLESLSTSNPPTDAQAQENGTQNHDGFEAKTKKRKRRLDDINVQMDLLLDKLCIWHATEEAGILDFEANFSKQSDGFDGNSKTGGSDRLHSFCVEVIIPFYINRLPEQALMVNKKLGGPAHQAPPKRKAMKPPTTSRKSGGSKEPEAKKSRRSLARVATDNTGKTIDRATPALSRSATDSILVSGIKREGSEVPLSAIPFQRSPSKGARQSMSQIRHLQGRQIDLAKPSAVATAKMKHKLRVEEDLKDAILALKKPNRDLAAGSYVADIEQRGLGLANKSRKPTNPVRRIVKDVQVSATPRIGRRTKNMIEQTPTHHQHNPFIRLPTVDGPGPNDFWVPSSAARPPSSMVPATVQRDVVTGRDLVRPSVAETPSKAPNTKTFTSGAARRMIFATPSKAVGPPSALENGAPSHVFETPSKPSMCSPPIDIDFNSSAITATPLKPTHSLPQATDLVAVSAPPSEDEEPSIYDALGWNDNDDDIL